MEGRAGNHRRITRLLRRAGVTQSHTNAPRGRSPPAICYLLFCYSPFLRVILIIHQIWWLTNIIPGD